MYGGAERYQEELCNVIRSLGHEPAVFQTTRRPDAWQQVWNGTRVYGLPLPKAEPGQMADEIASFNTHFTRTYGHLFDAVIYMTLGVAYPMVHHRAVAISHGITWDYPIVDFPPDKIQNLIYRLTTPVGLVQRVVSCDTNTINVWGALTSGKYLHRFTHIPNFVDTQVFKPAPRPADGRVRILFPRRLEAVRGFWLAKAVAEYVVDKYPNVEFYFVGRGENAEVEELFHEECDAHERWSYNWYPSAGMERAYQSADISIIPTLGAEGTSLSLLEAMASGNAIVASYVGGLSELIIDSYNGFKTEPTVEHFIDVLSYLIEHPEVRERVSRNAVEVAREFDVSKWRARWSAVLTDLLR